VRVYQYDVTKTTAVTNQASSEFGPVGWRRLGADIDGEAGSDYGYRVSLSSDGTIVAIGAYQNDGTGLSNSGHVRVYQYDANKDAAVTDQTASDFGPAGWNRLGADIDGEAGSDYSGISVSLSSDGSIVAIGAHYNDSNGFNSSGHVRVYKYDVTKTMAQPNQTLANFGPVGWRRLGADIDGEAAGDLSGYSVSLSSAGSTVVIGAPYNDGTGFSNAGHVRIYQIPSSLSPQVGDWAVAEHKEESTGQLLATYTYRVIGVTDADTLVLGFVSSSDPGGLSNSVYSYNYTPYAGQLDSGLAFSPDGTKVFFIDHRDDLGASHIHRWNLGTPWDITSSSYAGGRTLSMSSTSVRDITFSSDGMKLYATDGLFDTIMEWTLSSPWNLYNFTINITGTLDAVGDNPWGLTFSSDGTKLYVSDRNPGLIHWYALTTPWDIDTAVLADQSLSVSSQDNYPRSIEFSSDGRDLYVLGGQNDTIYQYTLTTPWDLSTASYSGYSLYVGSQDLGPVGMVIPPGRNELYMAGQSNGAVYRYTLPEEYSDASPCDLCDGTGDVGVCGGIAPHVIKRDLGGMFMMLLD
jgi:WD40 repeat protein